MKKVNENKSKGSKNRKKKNVVARRIILFFVILLIIVALLIGAGAWYASSLLSEIKYVEIDESKLEINEEVTIGDEYTSIALFGVDARGNTYENTRSDCIIIAVLNKETKNIKLVSVYRDTYVDIRGSLDKITHAYAYGGPELALATINKNLDLNVTKFATANFYAVIDFIDAVGGIDLEIDKDEVNYINDYIKALNIEQHRNSAYINKPGTYHLDGVQALAYSRIRYTAGGDWKRTERMRTTLMKAFNKAKTMNILDIDKIVRKLLPEITTNISSTELIGMVKPLLEYTIDESVGWPYVVKGATINGVWYGPAVTLESCVKKLHEEVFLEKDYQVSSTVKQISNRIIQKTGYK